MKRFNPTVTAFAVVGPLTMGMVALVVFTRPGSEAPAGAIPTATSTSAAPTATPTGPMVATATPIPAKPSSTPPSLPIATPQTELMRELSGLRFGVIDVVSNETGEDLPFPAEYAIDGHFIRETTSSGERVSFLLEGPPIIPKLSGTAMVGGEFNGSGGHGIASGSGRFMGVTTDFSMDFEVTNDVLSASVVIGRQGNLPGAKPLELSVTVGGPVYQPYSP
ncbi:MAG: hypothetical protein ABI577_08310 [bacterium]